MIKGILFDFGDTIVVEPKDLNVPMLESHIELLPHAEGTLSELAKTYRLAVVSNTMTAGDEDITEALSRVGVARYFDAVVTSVSLGIAKPNPGIFLHALKQIGLDPVEAAMVGDRLETDILGANRLGIRSIHFRWNDRHTASPSTPEHEPDATIQSLKQLLGHPILGAAVTPGNPGTRLTETT